MNIALEDFNSKLEKCLLENEFVKISAISSL